jgi:hypothetical protein
MLFGYRHGGGGGDSRRLECAGEKIQWVGLPLPLTPNNVVCVVVGPPQIHGALQLAQAGTHNAVCGIRSPFAFFLQPS